MDVLVRQVNELDAKLKSVTAANVSLTIQIGEAKKQSKAAGEAHAALTKKVTEAAALQATTDGQAKQLQREKASLEKDLGAANDKVRRARARTKRLAPRVARLAVARQESSCPLSRAGVASPNLTSPTDPLPLPL